MKMKSEKIVSENESPKYKITSIQLYDFVEQRQISEDYEFEVVYSYSANIAINDSFMAQVYGNEKECGFEIPASDEIYWKNESDQDKAFEEIDRDELEKYLEADGFENNIGWLEDDHRTEVMNPENAQYRTT